jgi:hypothetical protein
VILWSCSHYTFLLVLLVIGLSVLLVLLALLAAVVCLVYWFTVDFSDRTPKDILTVDLSMGWLVVLPQDERLHTASELVRISSSSSFRIFFRPFFSALFFPVHSSFPCIVDLSERNEETVMPIQRRHRHRHHLYQRTSATISYLPPLTTHYTPLYLLRITPPSVTTITACYRR